MEAWVKTEVPLPCPHLGSLSPTYRVCWLPWPTSATRLEWMPSFRTTWTPPQIPTQPTPPTLVPLWKTTSSRPSPRMWRLLRVTSLPLCTEQPGTKRQGGCLGGPPLYPGLLSRFAVQNCSPLPVTVDSQSMPFCIPAAARAHLKCPEGLHRHHPILKGTFEERVFTRSFYCPTPVL